MILIVIFRYIIPSERSCLLANISIMASRISLSLIILCSSVRASSILSRSAQSTTNIRPCVPVGEQDDQLRNFKMYLWGALTCVVVPPERSNFVLPANVPNIELNILVRDSLHIEAHCGYRCHRLSQFQFIEDRWGRKCKSVRGVRQG